MAPPDAAQVDAFVRTSSSGFIPEGEAIPEDFLRTGARAPRAPEHDSFLARVGDELAGAGGCGTRSGATSSRR